MYLFIKLLSFVTVSFNGMIFIFLEVFQSGITRYMLHGLGLIEACNRCEILGEQYSLILSSRGSFFSPKVLYTFALCLYIVYLYIITILPFGN